MVAGLFRNWLKNLAWTLRWGGDRRRRRLAKRRPAPSRGPAPAQVLEERVLLASPGEFVGEVFRVAGTPDTIQTLAFDLTQRRTTNRNELGWFRVDSTDGSIAGVRPGDSRYLATALGQADRGILFSPTAAPLSRTSLDLPGGSLISFYIAQNSRAEDALRANPQNTRTGRPQVFFADATANADRFDHLQTTRPSAEEVQFAWEDQTGGGDRDFNDARLSLCLAQGPVYQVPGGAAQQVPVEFTLVDRRAAFRNELGVIRVDDAQGRIDGLLPGASGYAAAALQSDRWQPVFATTASRGARVSLTLAGGSFFQFYGIPRNSTATHRLKNANNVLGQPAIALLGVAAANPDRGTTHFLHTCEGVVRFEDQLFGGDRDFNDATLKFAFGTPVGGTAPGMTLSLVADSGASGTDRLTSDPRITGVVSSSQPITAVEAALAPAGGSTAAFQSVFANYANGVLSLNQADLVRLLGASLADGPYRLQTRARDTGGLWSPVASLDFTLDTQTGVPEARLQTDTGSSATDRITSDSTLTGTATDANGVAKLEAALDRGTGVVTFTDITQRLANGQYVLSPTDLAGLLGGALTDGSYRVSIRQTDVAGNLSTVRELLFVLDTSTTAPQVGLQNDTGSSATDRITSDPTLTGTASDANGVAKLEAALDRGTGVVTFTDITNRLANGQYVLSPTDLAGLLGGALEDGTYRVSVRMTTSAGVVSEVREYTFVLDQTVALPAVELLNDTGSSPTDRITRDSALKGTAADLHGVAKLEGALDGGTGSPVFQDITGNLLNGVLNLTPSDLAVLAGGPLADGVHRLSLRLTDGAGNTSGIGELVWTLDTVAPAVTLDLAPGMALPLPGNPTTNLAVVTLVGTTEAGVPVVLTPGALNTNASNTGSFSYAGIALALGDNPFTAQATDVAGNVGSVSVTITRAVPLESCAFEPGLPGWVVSQTGGTDAGQGTVVVEGCDAVLREGDSFSVTLSRTFVVTASTTSLDFRFQSPQFDLSDPAAINDAFEAALLDADGLPLVPTYLPGRDAFWNQSEGLPAAWGTSTTAVGQTVTLDLTGIPVGTTATLVFRLVNNDGDQNTTVRLWNATVPPAVTGSLGFREGSRQPSGVTSLASPARGGAPLSELPASGTQSAGLSGGQSVGTGPGAAAGGMVGAQSSTLLTDPDDPRTWLGAGVGTFAALFFGADTPANRQKVVDQQLLDAGRFDVTLARPAKLISGPSSLGPNGAAQQLDTTGTGSFEYALRGSSAEETFGSIDDLGGQTRADVGGTVFDLETLAPRVAVFNNVDHGPLPQEAIESSVYLSSDGITWTQAVTQRLWLEGWHPNLGIQWDGFTYVVGTENNTPFRYVSVIHGGAGALLDDGDNELNAVAAVDEAFNPQPLLPPNLQVADPTSGRTSAGRQIVLSGLALPGQATTPLETVLVNGSPVDALDAAGNFFAVVDILPGENRWEFVATDSLGQTATTSLTIFGTQPIPGQVDFSQFADVSGSFAVDYARTSFDNGRRILFADSAVHNQGQYPAAVPLWVGVRNLSDPSVVPLNTAGTMPDGTPYYDFTGLVTGGRLQPGGATGMLTLPFFNPSRAQFSYDLVFYGLLNRAPEFTSVPRLEAVPGREYRYTATASDLDGDMLLFRLDSAPAGMTINAQTGELRWTPTTNDLGAHPIAITVSDPRGGSAEQRFQLGVVVAPPNRPPVITSDPVIQASVGTAYRYDVEASDPDADQLQFELLEAPSGMSIAGNTGLLSWTPTFEQLGSQRITVRVTDTRGGEATQTFPVCVGAPQGNHAPVIVSAPPTRFYVPEGLLLESKILDFSDAHPDFEDGISGLVKGLVRRELGPDRLPVFSAANGAGAITSAETFDQWFRDVPGVNQSTTYDLVLTETSPGSGILTFVSNDFFPIDGQLLGNQGRSHNYHFTMQTHTAFTYRGGEQFFFSGDDDVWVFINNQLVVDLGGIHATVADSVSLDSLGLEVGRTYPFDFFFCERHTVGSNFRLDTGMQLSTTRQYQYQIATVDPDGDPLSYTLINGPSGMQINSSTGEILWNPTLAQVGKQTVTVSVRDSHGAASIQSYDLEVSTQNASLTGKVWEDRNGDGIRLDEPGLLDKTVFIDANLNGQQDAGEWSTKTDTFGNFTFPHVPPGTYRVMQRPEPGMVLTTPVQGHHDVTVAEGATAGGLEFGNLFQADTGNRDPRFGDQPSASALAGSLWRWDPRISDPDGDSLAFDLSVAPEGMTVHPTLGTVVWIPTEDQVGNAQVVLRARDGRGGVALQSFEVRVTAPNTPPVVTSLPVGQPTVGFPFRYQVAAQDAEGDTVSFRFGNAAPAGATLQATSGTFEWTPTAGQAGPHTVNILADDGRGGVTPHVFSLVVAADSLNAPPVVQFNPRAAAPIDELFVAQVVARDPNGDPLTFSLPSRPDGMTIDAAGILRWTPSAAQLGRQTGQLLVSDGRGGDVSVEFAIDVVARQLNHAPVITSNPKLRATEGREYTLDLRGLDQDGDLVAWDLLTAPRGMSLDFARGTLRWTPTADQVGAHEVVVQISDAWGSHSTQSFTIDVACVNAGPEITSTPPTQAAVGRTYLYALRAGDPERDPLQFTLLSAPRGNMTLNAGTGLLRWTPDATEAGASVPVVIQVGDGQGNFATQRFVVEVAANPGSLPGVSNAPPVITSTPVYRATLDRPYVYATTARDPEGAVVSWSLREPPAGMTIDAATGRITWTPTVAGEQVVTVVATDPLGARAIQSYLLKIARNEAPQITSTPVTSAVEGGVYRYDVTARDPESDPLQYTLIASPAGMTIDSVGRLRWSVPSGALTPANVTVEVADAFGETARQTFTVTPTADVTPPRLKLMTSSQTVDSQGRVVVDLGTPLLFQVQSTDDVGTPTLSLSVDGVPLPLDTGASARWTVSRVGAVTVVATATDAAGNVSSQTLSLRVRDPNDSDAPFVEILSPNPLVDTNLVSYLTTIVGTVRDDNLLAWRLDYARSDAVDFYNDVAGSDSDWVTFATGNSSVTAAALGVFDPTLLANGQYVVRVFAEDTSGLITVRGVLLGVQGEAKLGNFRLEFTDLQIPVAGIPITVTRVYDTLHAREEGDFGYGWSLGLRDANIRETVPDNGGDFFTQSPFKNGTRVYLTDPDGKRIGFTFQPEFRSALLFAIARPRFIPDPGVTATLEDADLQDFALFQGKDGSYHGFFGVGNYNPENYILTTSNGVRYHYNEDQGLQKVVDRNGNTLTFDDAGIHSSGGDEVLFTRDGRGRITAITDPDGNQLRYTYNAAGDLVSFRDQVDLRTTFSYLATPAHYLDEIHDPLGRRASKTIYGPDGRVEKIIDALGNETRQSFDPGSFSGTITDAKGNVTKLVYDQRGNVVREEDPEGGVTLREYADAANPDKETKVIRLGENGRQIVTRYSYDPRGNRTTVTDSFGTTRFEYDVLGNVVKTIDALGHVTTASYNAQGHMTTLVNALGDSSTRSYDSNGRVATVTDFLGQTTELKYEPGCACGIPSSVVNPDGTRRYYVANEFGQVTLATDEVGVSAETVYDDGGRVVSERGPQGQETRYFYTGNELSRKEVQINATQVRTTLYAYFDDGKLKSETDALGGVVRYTYDKNGNLETLTDPENNVTRFVYDRKNRLIEEVDPLGQSRKYQYDLFGNRIAALDRIGRMRTFEYDDSSRLLAEKWWDGGSVVRTMTFTYDALGNLSSENDPDSRNRYTYDALRRVLTTDNGGTLNVPQRVLTNTYDKNSNRLTVGDNLGVSVVSTYDARNRLATRSWVGLPNGDARRVTFDYLGNGQPRKVSRYSDLAATHQVGTSEYTYDVSGRNDTLTHRDANGNSVMRYEYTYDMAYQLTRQSYDGVEGDFTANYQYDLFGQLTDVDYLNDAFPDEAYQYDLTGNRKTAQVIGEGRTYVRSAGNRYASDGIYTYNYDFEGNLTSRIHQATGEIFSFDYDHRNRLIKVTSRVPSGSMTLKVDYRYDTNNQRIATKTDRDGSGPEDASVVLTIHDGVHVWADRHLMGPSSVYYLFGDDMDQLLAASSTDTGASNQNTWYYADRLGSLVSSTNQLGQVQDVVLYDSYGNRLRTSPSADFGRFSFTGREYDNQTDLLNYRSREYSAEIGRFLTTDTIGFESGDANLYRYVLNSPVTFTDPFGTTVFAEYTVQQQQAVARASIIKCLGIAAFTNVAEAGIYILLTSVVGTPTGPSNLYVGQTNNFEVRFSQHAGSGVGGRGAEILSKIKINLSPDIINNPQKLRTAEQLVMNAFGGKAELLNVRNASRQLFCPP